MTWRIASSPRLSPRYEPEMPTFSNWSPSMDHAASCFTNAWNRSDMRTSDSTGALIDALNVPASRKD